MAILVEIKNIIRKVMKYTYTGPLSIYTKNFHNGKYRILKNSFWALNSKIST